MNSIVVAQKYFDAWNRRDADGIAALFVEGGTYHDPTTPQPLTGEAIAHFATGLWASFPDTTFEIVSIAQNDDGLVAASGSVDGTLRIWDVPTGTCRHTLRGDRRYERLDITGLTGVTPAQRGALLALGAIERSAVR